MRRLPSILLLLLLLASCATYTVQNGYDAITLPPPPSGQPATKLSEIQEENARKSAEAVENAKKEAEHRALMRRDAAVNGYPDDLSALTLPHVYTPLKTDATKADGLVTASILVLPLGYEAMTAEDAERILASVSDVEADFAVLTGSLENQVLGARTAGWDAVTMAGGTILHRPLLKEAKEHSASFFLSTTRDLEIAPLGFEDAMPSDASGIPAWLEGIGESGESEAAAVLAAAGGMEDRERVIVLSSSSPSSEDWSDLTPFSYRTDADFAVSDALSSAGWLDAYRRTHYTAETDGGITRRNGSIYERLDFIYTQSLIPLDAISFPVAGLTDRTGAFAVLATLLIP